MSYLCHYVFVVHSRLVLTRLPLAKAFPRAILTVNTYPFDWHLRREYMDIQPSTYPQFGPSSSRAAPAAPSPFCPLRFVDGTSAVIPSRHRHRIASVRAFPVNWSHPFGSSRWAVTRIVTRRYLKDKFTASFPRQSYSCFVSISFSDGACPLPPPN